MGVDFYHELIIPNEDLPFKLFLFEGLGVAILAGVGCGIYPSVEAACDLLIHEKSSTEPVAEEAETYAGYHKVYQNLYRSLKADFRDLAKL